MPGKLVMSHFDDSEEFGKKTSKWRPVQLEILQIMR
jgi:hypothetical protein